MGPRMVFPAYFQSVCSKYTEIPHRKKATNKKTIHAFLNCVVTNSCMLKSQPRTNQPETPSFHPRTSAHFTGGTNKLVEPFLHG